VQRFTLCTARGEEGLRRKLSGDRHRDQRPDGERQRWVGGGLVWKEVGGREVEGGSTWGWGGRPEADGTVSGLTPALSAMRRTIYSTTWKTVVEEDASIAAPQSYKTQLPGKGCKRRRPDAIMTSETKVSWQTENR